MITCCSSDKRYIFIYSKESHVGWPTVYNMFKHELDPQQEIENKEMVAISPKELGAWNS